ncbi:MAG TPA: ATP-binding protein [Pyrinomonadaceae bacterium]|nr:ATP-binding protein [Pyrinomonadaceae bacterium]
MQDINQMTPNPGVMSGNPGPADPLTALKRQLDAQTALCSKYAASEQIWESMIDAGTDAVYVFGEDRRLMRMNQAAERLESAQRLFLMGRRCCEMFWHVDDGKCMVDRALERSTPVEVEIPLQSDANRTLLVRVIPPRVGDRAAKCLVIARDISELRKAEREANKHRASLASLVDLAPAEIYTVDQDSHVTWMNQRAEIGTGLTPSVVLNRDFTMFVSAESQDEAHAMLQNAMSGVESQAEITTQCGDGRERYMDAYASPLWQDGNISGAMVFMSDMTERKLARERAARSDKLRALGELAAGVAHNVNNSLTVIQGRSQLMSINDSENKHLKIIMQAIRDCSATLQRLLDFSRRDSTRTTVPVDLTEVVKSSVEISRPKWQSKSATRSGSIDIEIDAPSQVMTLGNVSELREVALNLIFNAVDAMPEGGLIKVGARADERHAFLWVEDSGVGMTKEVLAKIFEPFYSTKGDSGTGLGLSASHGIIENHDGSINVKSEIGKGTRFEIVLPRHDRDAGRATNVTSDADAQVITDNG